MIICSCVSELLFLVKMSSVHSSSSSPYESVVFSSGKSKRKKRGISKKPKGRFTITRVDASGTPLSPRRAASAFRTTVRIVAHKRVKITYNSWKDLTKDQKDTLVTEILQSFLIPEEHQASEQRYTLLAACKVWRNFKSTLIKNYVEKDLTCFQKYPFVDEY